MIEQRKLLILLVDADPALRRTAREALVAQGHRAVEIPKPSEAMDTAKNVQFDLLIADMLQPFALDLANAMARMNPQQKVLFLCDYAPGMVESFGIFPPGTEVLQKPFDKKVLSERVRNCLSSGKSWATLISAWRRTGSPQGRRDENLESSSLTEMA